MKNISGKINVMTVKMKHNSCLSGKYECQLLSDRNLKIDLSGFFPTEKMSKISQKNYKYDFDPFLDQNFMRFYSQVLINGPNCWLYPAKYKEK